MIVALDTNLLVYASGIDDAQRRDYVVAMLEKIRADDIVLPVQVLAELYRVLIRKAGLSRTDAAANALSWESRYSLVGTSPEVMRRSVALSVRHQFAIWDAIVLASAAEAGCRILLSEDMRHDFKWSGVTIVNPFHDPIHHLLEQALQS